jgi:hypothetical protein
VLITCRTAWYIPPEWLNPSDPAPRNILEAAQLAQRLAAEGSHNIPYSKIPLIVHQTWKDTDLVTWKPEVLEGVEKWLTYATAPGNESMAYFLWLDEGCKQLISGLQPDLVEYVDALPLMVEKSDIFRVLMVKLIGGVVSFCVFNSLRILILMFHSMEISIHCLSGIQHHGLMRLTLPPGRTPKQERFTAPLPNRHHQVNRSN